MVLSIGWGMFPASSRRMFTYSTSGRFVRMALALAAGMAGSASARVLVPTVFEAGHVYVVPEGRDGNPLRLLVDSGGSGGSGMFVLSADAAHRLGAKIETCGAFGDSLSVVRALAFKPGRALPLVGPTGPCHALAMIVPHLDDDGILGAGYMPNFIWTFDYPRHALWVEDAGWTPPKEAVSVPLHFPHRPDGEKGSGFPRMALSVDGQMLDCLFDTGATAMPTSAGEAASHVPTVHGVGVTSYIVTSVFEKWHHDHPQWRVVENGDRLIKGMRLIEVPQVTLGWAALGHGTVPLAKTGPVWFTERADVAFGSSGISQYMDGPVYGSIGANIYGKFVVTVDYPNEKLWLRPGR